MADFVDMTLKILYTLDDGTNTSNSISYLARSKKPQRVRVVSIPNPNDLYSNNNIINHNKINKFNTTITTNNNNHHKNDSNADRTNNNNIYINNGSNINEKFNGLNTNDCDINLNVGLINLSTVLKEIYTSSPEVLQIDNDNNNSSNSNVHTQINRGEDIRIDYNVYYKDICEVNEPLVSLGLLSDIQSRLNKLRRHNNNSNNNNNNNGNKRFRKSNNDNNNNNLTEIQEENDENIIVIGEDDISSNTNTGSVDNIDVQEGLEEQEYDNNNDNNNGDNADNSENEDYEDEDEDEDLIVTGRVCSNFSALLRRSYSNSHNSMNNKNNNSSNTKKNSKKDLCMNTLEIKLKFSKIIVPKKSKYIPRASTIARRQNTMVISPLSITSPTVSTAVRTATSETSSTPQYSVPSLPKKINKIVKQKRQTNPMPAPKAERTQSLPIWNLSASGLSLRNGKTSIAHKIFMADRLMEEHNSNSNLSSTYPRTQMFTYEINSLQNDNTVQRNIVDDSVSKRFDFMNKKLNNNNSNGNSPLNVGGITAKQTSTKTKKSKAIKKPKARSKSTNTTASKNKKRSQSQSQNTPILINDSFVTVDSNKENVPPLNNIIDNDDNNNANMAPIAERMDTKPIDPIHTDQLDLYSLNFDENVLNWFEDVTKNQSDNKETMTPAFIFDNDTLKFNSIIVDHSSKNHYNSNNSTSNTNTNTNNTVTPRDIIDDPDRTSPLDTLSMPLMELEETRPGLANLNSEDGLVHNCHNTGLNQKDRKHITTCQEQLNRLPILAPSHSNLSQLNSNNNNNKSRVIRNGLADTPKESNNMDDAVGSEATILLNYNTSPINILPNDNSSKGNLRNINNYKSNNDEFDEEEKKRQRILPSSPSMIFEYRSASLQTDENDSDNEDDEHMTPDLFTKFINQNNDKMDNITKLDQLDVLPNDNNKFGSDFNEMRFSNNDIYTPATTVNFTSDEK